MEFSRGLREDVISGGITVSFRLWRRPKVREGGRCPVGFLYRVEFHVVTSHAGR